MRKLIHTVYDFYENNPNYDLVRYREILEEKGYEQLNLDDRAAFIAGIRKICSAKGGRIAAGVGTVLLTIGGVALKVAKTVGKTVTKA